MKAVLKPTRSSPPAPQSGLDDLWDIVIRYAKQQGIPVIMPSRTGDPAQGPVSASVNAKAPSLRLVTVHSDEEDEQAA